VRDVAKFRWKNFEISVLPLLQAFLLPQQHSGRQHGAQERRIREKAPETSRT